MNFKMSDDDGPDSVATDADGRFRISGYGKDRWLNLTLKGAQVGHGSFIVLTRPKPDVEPLSKQGLAILLYKSSKSATLR